MERQHATVALIVLVVLTLITGSVAHEPSPYKPSATHVGVSEHISSNREKRAEKPIILVHDVTPYYFDDLREITAIIDQYNYSNRTVLFVIPVFDPTHYGDRWDLRKHRDFVNYLHELERKGYHIELHGYGHTYHEFNCSYEVAKEKLERAMGIMNSLGFTNITLFLPPAWAINNESLRAILEYNLTVVMPNWLIFPNGTRQRIWNREYTWYISEEQVDSRLSVALHDYRRATEEGIPFYLSLHPGVINKGGGLDFLRKFLREFQKP
jgi:predicted deacetylase